MISPVSGDGKVDERREAVGAGLPFPSPVCHSFRLHPPALVGRGRRAGGHAGSGREIAATGHTGPLVTRFGRGRHPGGRPARTSPPAGRDHCRVHGPARFAMAGRFDRRPAVPAVSVQAGADRRRKGRRFRNGPWCAILDPARAPYLHRGWLCCLTCPTRGACPFFRIPVRRWRPAPASCPIPSDRRRRAGSRPSVKQGAVARRLRT